MSAKQVNFNQTLIDRLKVGDSAAFNELYDLFATKLLNFSFQYTHNKEDSEEIVQETFIRIWEHRENIREDLSLNAYIIKIARNLIYNRAKRRVREKAMKTYYTNTEGVDNSTENQIIFSDLNKFENQLLDQLPQRRKEILQLKKSGYSNTEIAEQLDISKSTVENSINKALKFLHAYFKSGKLIFLGFIIKYFL